MFDLGGVVEDHRLDKLAELLARKCNADKKKFYSFMMYNLRLNDKCTITDMEFIRRINRKFGMALTHKKFYEFYYKFIKQRYDVVNFVKSLSGKYKLAIFSNTRKMHLKESLRRVDYRKIFDYIFISQAYCTRKPELKFYKIALKTMNVMGRDCIFIDDKERNFPPARSLGIKCIKFTSLAELNRKLKRYGVQ